MKVNEEYGFQEIYLLPNYCVAGSRDDCDPSVVLGKIKFISGVIPANMSSVVDDNTCLFLAEKKWFYIMHRFGTNNLRFVNLMHEAGYFASISIGVNVDSEECLKEMKLANVIPDYITLDIANAYSIKAKNMVKVTKDLFPESFLIVGNCATEEAVLQIGEWGADAIKVGISNGHVCETYMATGFSRPQFSTILECCRVSKKPIISDGGIRNIGDISKAYVAGAKMVMAGNLFAGFYESAGEIIEIEGKRYKQYFGSASYNNTRSKKNVEGKCILVDFKGNMQKLLWDIDDRVRSAISYAGGTDLSAFNNVKWGIRAGGTRQSY